MNVVIDENVSYDLVINLRAKGYKVLSIAEKSTKGLSDRMVFSLAENLKAILITRDHHFLNPLRFPPNKTKGIIYIRQGNLSSTDEIKLVLRFLDSHSPEFFCGRLIILSTQGIRLR